MVGSNILGARLRLSLCWTIVRILARYWPQVLTLHRQLLPCHRHIRMRSLRKSRGHRSQTRVKLEGYVCVARGDEVAEWQASHYCWQRTMGDRRRTSKAASNAASASGKFSSLSKCLTSMPAKSLGVFLNSGQVRSLRLSVLLLRLSVLLLRLSVLFLRLSVPVPFASIKLARQAGADDNYFRLPISTAQQ